MKTTLFLVLIIISIAGKTQMFGTLGTGIDLPKIYPMGIAGLGFQLDNGITLKADMKFLTSRSQPAFFGITAGYHWKFIEAGIGGYYMLYSTDKYDSYKNQWEPEAYTAAFFKIFFIQIEYLNHLKCEAGVRLNLN